MLLATAMTADAQPRRERASFSLNSEAKADLDGESGDSLALSEVEVSVGYPILRRPDGTLTLGLRYIRSDFDISSARITDFDAVAVNVPLRYTYRGMTNWTWMASLSPGLHTDFDGITSDDIRAAALLIGTRTMSPEWSLSGGLVYNQDFGRSRVFPAIGALWQPDARWRIEALMPRPRVVYSPTESVDAYWLIEPSGDSWNIRLPEGSRNVGLGQWRTGLGLDVRLGRGLALFVQAGWVFDRELEIRDGRDKVDSLDIDDTWSVRAGLRFL